MKMNNTFGWNVKAQLEDSDSAEIELYGEVKAERPRDFWTGEEIDEECICPKGFAEAIEPLKGKSKITVRLNTVGGDASVGLFIHNKLKALGSKIHVIVDGLAASAGSIIMCAGDTVSVYPNSMVMIHEAKCGVSGYLTVSDMKKIENRTKAYNDMIVATYVQKTGLPEEKLRGMIARETWFIGQEAVDNGFADDVIEGDSSLNLVACADNKQMIGRESVGVTADFFIPQRIKDKLRMVTEQNHARTAESAVGAVDSAGESVMDKHKENGGNTMDKINSVADLEKAYPDFCNSLKESAAKEYAEKAIATERNRMQEIDSIASEIDNKSLVEKAKYETGISASELLMQDVLGRKERRKNIIGDIDNDAVATKEVGSVVTSVETNEISKPLTKAERFAKGVAAAKGGK